MRRPLPRRFRALIGTLSAVDSVPPSVSTRQVYGFNARVHAGDVMHDDADLAPVLREACLPLGFREGAGGGDQCTGPLFETIGEGVRALPGLDRRRALWVDCWLVRHNTRHRLILSTSSGALHRTAISLRYGEASRQSYERASDLSSRPSAGHAGLLPRPNRMLMRPAQEPRVMPGAQRVIEYHLLRAFKKLVGQAPATWRRATVPVATSLAADV